MGMNIKNDETHALARELAALDNTSLTEAVSTALREALLHRQALSSDRMERARDTLELMRAQLAASPGPSLHEVNASLYDDHGLPR
jgi:antitoxin VapB